MQVVAWARARARAEQGQVHALVYVRERDACPSPGSSQPDTGRVHGIALGSRYMYCKRFPDMMHTVLQSEDGFMLCFYKTQITCSIICYTRKLLLLASLSQLGNPNTTQVFFFNYVPRNNNNNHQEKRSCIFAHARVNAAASEKEEIGIMIDL